VAVVGFGVVVVGYRVAVGECVVVGECVPESGIQVGPCVDGTWVGLPVGWVAFVLVGTVVGGVVRVGTHVGVTVEGLAVVVVGAAVDGDLVVGAVDGATVVGL
jgi:hypothetical protein